jgi:hypothetical protein
VIRLDKVAIDQALPRVAVGLRKYCWLQAALATTDVARDRGFQTRFNAFYRVRRGAAWRSAFFTLLQQEKSCPQPFAKILRGLHAATGRVEPSFASKLEATVDPDKPVIDSFVLKNVGLRLPPRGAVELRLVRVEQLYERLVRVYAEFLDAGIGRYLVDRFVESYPARPVTPVKMLDLVLWQTRQAAEQLAADVTMNVNPRLPDDGTV